jgi:tetratricopeptide (TPR) repeat protein
MSFLKKLLGRRDPESERSQADALFAEGDFGRAKLAYERAANAFEREAPETAAQLRARVNECRDALADQRLAEARRLHREGALELAFGELEAALEIAASDAVRTRAEALAAELEGGDAPPGDEDSPASRYEMLAVAFEEAQRAEYDLLGPRMRDALLLLAEDHAGDARPLLEGLLEETELPRYLHFEVGRARLLTDDRPGARQALSAFLEALDPDEGGDTRLAAHLELATLAHEAEDFEAAVDQHQLAIEHAPEDPRPYLAMGRFFREESLAAEAIDVLQSAAAVLGAPHPLICRELALAHRQDGDAERARTLLQQALSLAPEGEPLAEQLQADLSELDK